MVLLSGLPQDQHGQLGEVVAGEHVDRAAVDHLPRRREPVAVEAGTVGDPDRAPHASALARPGPGAPAKACAMETHSFATGPCTVRWVSSTWRRWVTVRQKSSAGPSTRSAAASSPHV